MKNEKLSEIYTEWIAITLQASEELSKVTGRTQEEEMLAIREMVNEMINDKIWEMETNKC